MRYPLPASTARSEAKSIYASIADRLEAADKRIGELEDRCDAMRQARDILDVATDEDVLTFIRDTRERCCVRDCTHIGPLNLGIRCTKHGEQKI